MKCFSAPVAFCSVLLFLLPLFQLKPQDNMDDFFDTPDETLDVQPIEEEEDALQEETEQEGEQEDPEDEPDRQDQEQGDGQDQADKDQEAADSVDIGELTTSPLKFSGSVTAGVGAGVGLESWPEAL
ncbi:MAG: hypothetical protein ACLFMZ_11810, partial [Spirochaetaceae bacterium]